MIWGKGLCKDQVILSELHYFIALEVSLPGQTYNKVLIGVSSFSSRPGNTLR